MAVTANVASDSGPWIFPSASTYSMRMSGFDSFRKCMARALTAIGSVMASR